MIWNESGIYALIYPVKMYGKFLSLSFSISMQTASRCNSLGVVLLFLENSADAVVTPFLLYFHYDLSACVLVASSSHLINVRAFLGVGAIVPAPLIDLVG